MTQHCQMCDGTQADCTPCPGVDVEAAILWAVEWTATQIVGCFECPTSVEWGFPSMKVQALYAYKARTP